MFDTIIAIIIAGLYSLGVYQGRAFFGLIQEVYEGSGFEIKPSAKFMMTWLWPVATVQALLTNPEDEEDSSLG